MNAALRESGVTRAIPTARMVGLALALTIVYVGVISLMGPSVVATAWLPAVATLLVLLANLEFAFVVVVSSLFIDHPISWFSFSVWTSFLLVPAFFWRHRSEEVPQFDPALRRALTWYGLSIIPSLLVSGALFASVYRLLNVAAFLVVLTITAASVRQPRHFSTIAAVFIGWALLNTFDVIVESQVLQRRTFGFAGIMFVDYAALGVCVTATMAILARGALRWSLASASMLLTIGSALSQTRNTWLSAAIALAFLAFYVLRYPERVGTSRRHVSGSLAIGSAVLVFSIATAIMINPGVEQRTMQLAQSGGSTPAISQSGGVSSSLVSRALIWSTALNAFTAHPITGIGVYAFPFLSRQYASMPPLLYRKFVEQLTPHQTHLAVLSETGMIGFAGFTLFLITAFRLALRAVRRGASVQRRGIALVLLVGLVYVCASMVFTDAWLWGPLIVVFGILLGMTVANERDGAHEPSLASDPVRE